MWTLIGFQCILPRGTIYMFSGSPSEFSGIIIATDLTGKTMYYYLF